ncbi:MAG: hypothetical protein C4B57_02080 [Deltaproteobacteria bacterium]|nr:DUF5320 domain-containing protein [Deltaproteobacteria bacterium]MBW1967168.1 DUF5320 domain-containing protein [Deltaproteobacteria bacterium]MBW2098329.1 DUF5320 domain-containing protein [Deltaproteobacteria bacterium]PXF55812.1 MAG: hypothetical protein C4B57_02080 [Deltaproteobacteria bacterium]
MPGFDRTGPLGRGPKTGRGLGRCGKARTATASDTVPGGAVRSEDWPAAGRGLGRGIRRGRRGGPGRGRIQAM